MGCRVLRWKVTKVEGERFTIHSNQVVLQALLTMNFPLRYYNLYGDFL